MKDDITLDSDPTLREALQRHLAESGFPPDGGVHDRWAVLRVGPVPFCLPNLAMRRRAMLPHDLNHVVSGYGHDLIGEAEVSAWELGSGCKDYAAAWILAWSAVGAGVFINPRRTYGAFVRGRRTKNLFGADVERMMELPVGTAQSSLGLDASPASRPGDLALFVLLVAAAPLVGALPVIVSVVTSPAWIAQGAHRQRRPSSSTI